MNERRDSTRDELHELIGTVLNGVATAAQTERLESIMATDRDARMLYLRMVRLHGDLRAPRAVAIGPATATPEPVALRSTRFAIAPLALAAALLLAATVVVVYVFVLTAGPDEPDSPVAPIPVATLIDATGDVIVNDDIANPGHDYIPGRYTIASGFAEFQLSSGANIRLRGDSALQIHSPMRSALLHGSATFHCPPSAAGYAVSLPGGGRVIDLGTRFSIDALDGRSVIGVREGQVEVEHASLDRPISLVPPMVCVIDDRDPVSPVRLARRLLIRPASIRQVAGDTLGGYTPGHLLVDDGHSAPPRLGIYPPLEPAEAGTVSYRWVTALSTGSGYFSSPRNPRPRFVLTLERPAMLRAMVVWGYGGNANEASDFRVEFSNDGGATWGKAVQTVSTDRLLGDDAAELRFDRPHKADAVRITITNNAAGRGFGGVGGDRVGLGAVRLVGDEPLDVSGTGDTAPSDGAIKGNVRENN